MGSISQTWGTLGIPQKAVYGPKPPGAYFNADAYSAGDDTDKLLAAAAVASQSGGSVLLERVFTVDATILVNANFVYFVGPGGTRDFSDTASFPNSALTFPPLAGIVPSASFPAGSPLVQFGSTGNNFMIVGGGVKYLLLSGNPGTPGTSNGWLVGDLVQGNNIHDLRVLGNTLESATGRGVYGSCNIAGGQSNWDIARNLIRSLQDAAVYLDSGTETGNRVRRNFVSSVTNYGILDSGGNNFVDHNYIESVAASTGYASGTGIFKGSEFGLISANIVNGTEQHGIYCGVGHVPIVGNLVLAPNGNGYAQGSGIFLENAATGSVSGNDILDPNGKMTYGIYANLAAGGEVEAGANSIAGAVTAPIGWNGIGSFRAHNNPGYNPVGQVKAPGTAMPASGTAIAAVPYDSFITIANGADSLTAEVSGGTAISYTLAANATGTYFVPAGETLTPTYAGGAPTYAQQGL